MEEKRRLSYLYLLTFMLVAVVVLQLAIYKLAEWLYFCFPKRRGTLDYGPSCARDSSVRPAIYHCFCEYWQLAQFVEIFEV